MRKNNSSIFLLLIIILSQNAVAQLSEEQVNAFKNAKRIRLIINQSYGDLELGYFCPYRQKGKIGFRTYYPIEEIGIVIG